MLKTSDNAAEEANANEKIRHIKDAHNGAKVDGIADELTLTQIETPEGSKTVATGALYDHDATHDIKGDMLADCSRELEELMKEKTEAGTIKDSTKLEKFFEKYGSLLTPEEIASVKAELLNS